MARYSLYVLKVPLNTKQTNKQTNKQTYWYWCVCVLELVCVYLYMGMCLIALLLLSFMTNKVEYIYCLGPYLSVSVLALSRRTCL